MAHEYQFHFAGRPVYLCEQAPENASLEECGDIQLDGKSYCRWCGEQAQEDSPDG